MAREDQASLVREDGGLSRIPDVPQVGCLPQFIDEWKKVTTNRFILNMVKGHHLQIKTRPPLFRNFSRFDIRCKPEHRPVIQEEVDKLLAKGAIEPSPGGPGFYSSVFVIPK